MLLNLYNVDAVRAMRDLAAVCKYIFCCVNLRDTHLFTNAFFQYVDYDVNGRLDLKFNYIGKADNSTSYGVTCPHGKSGKSVQEYMLSLLY